MTRPAGRKPSRVAYWTVFTYGGGETICTKHKTLGAAIEASRECEKSGGVKHRILRVERVR